MKVTIRQSVFETNSSSEHSLAIVNTKDFLSWKEGKSYARQLPGHKDFEETWGNFWSELYTWEFKEMTQEEAEKENKKLFKDYLNQEETNLKMCWKHYEDVKTWKTGDDEYFEREEDKQNWLENQKRYIEEYEKEIKKYTFDHMNNVRKYYNNFYISYKEYLDALRNGDCYSPFEHTQGDVSVFGIYFHS